MDIEDRLKMIEIAVNKLHDQVEELRLKDVYDKKDLWNYYRMQTGKIGIYERMDKMQ